MAGKGKFDYGEFKALYKSVAGIKSGFNAWAHDFLLRRALEALRLVRPMTPVDTGTLRRTWSISKVERTGNSLVVYLVNVMEYASFMENGFTKRNGEMFEGFHMAELSLVQVRQAMPAKYEREFAQWVKSRGWGS